MKRDTLQELATRLKIRENPTIDMFTRQIILHTFDQMQIKAEAESKCKQNPVASSILEIDLSDELIEHYSAVNGHNVQECMGKWNSHIKNIICDCGHAESRAMIKYMKSLIGKPQYLSPKNIKTILISTHLPCINCSNIIIDSGLIDVVAYEDAYPNVSFVRHNVPLDKSSDVRLWTKYMIKRDIENKHIKSWLRLS